jgi:hypothetical protein
MIDHSIYEFENSSQTSSDDTFLSALEEFESQPVELKQTRPSLLRDRTIPIHRPIGMSEGRHPSTFLDSPLRMAGLHPTLHLVNGVLAKRQLDAPFFMAGSNKPLEIKTPLVPSSENIEKYSDKWVKPSCNPFKDPCASPGSCKYHDK